MSLPSELPRRLPAWLVAACGGLLLGFASPPALLPGAEFLVLPGLALWFVVATVSPRPKLHSYLLGCVHMAWFAWSVRHVMWPAYIAIVVLGGLYFVVATVATRAVAPRLAAPMFAIASAASFWLRAEMPEICFPHGQPCHDLWQWPALLASVRVGGEPLANALLAGLAATAVVAWRSWRLGAPAWSQARRQLLLALTFAVLGTALGNVWRGRAASGAAAQHVRVGVVEPGLHPFDPFLGLPVEEARRRFRSLFDERWLQPTRELLAAPEPPALVLWPESSLPDRLTPEELARASPRRAFALPLARSLLVCGINLQQGAQSTPIALVVGQDGQTVGWHEKQRLVPGGEFVPFLSWLPEAARAVVHGMFLNAMGSAPDAVPGQFRPPLHTADGVPFAVLTCYDNAFPAPAAAQVAAGARLLCVISNEAWYRGGGELTQLVAMTVCRCLENAVPMVRCTMDGWSVAVGADGHLLAGLPLRPAPAAAPQKMLVDLPLAETTLAPVPWLRANLGPAAALLLGFALLHSLVSWARLLSSRTAPQAASGAGVRSRSSASGS